MNGKPIVESATMANPDDFDPITRRRAKREASRRRNLLIVAAAAGGMVLLAGMMLVLATLSRQHARHRAGGSIPIVSSLTGPSPTREGVSWNHQELLDYLNSKGLNIRIATADIAMYGSDWKTYFYKPQKGTDSPESVAIGFVYASPDIVQVEIMPSPQSAHDSIGTRGERGYNWGRFAFFGTKGSVPLLRQIRAALD